MSDETPQAVEACHDLILWVIPKLDQFPRARRFTLGSRIENLLIEILERLVCAAYSKSAEKARHLEAANLKLDVLRHLWRMASQLKIVSPKAYRFASDRFLDLGSQIGGWKKNTESRA